MCSSVFVLMIVVLNIDSSFDADKGLYDYRDVRYLCTNSVAGKPMSPPVSQKFIEAIGLSLKSSDVRAKYWAIYAIGHFRLNQFEDVLYTSVMSDSINVRYMSLKSLGLLGTPRGISFLKKHLFETKTLYEKIYIARTLYDRNVFYQDLAKR